MTDTSKEVRFFIRKQGYFYRPNSKGYTSSAICAGLYTEEEAIRITHPNGPDGPRDGMSYIAEHIWHDEDWQKYRALLSERDALREQADRWKSNSRDTWEAMCAMRNAINEHLPLPSIESDLLQGPENGVFCEVLATAVCGAMAELRAQLQAARDGGAVEYVCPDDETALNYLDATYGNDMRCAVSCMIDALRALKSTSAEGEG